MLCSKLTSPSYGRDHRRRQRLQIQTLDNSEYFAWNWILTDIAVAEAGKRTISMALLLGDMY